MHKQKRFHVGSITFEPDTVLDCENCKLAWLKDYWKKKKLDASNEIVKFFTNWFSKLDVVALSENHHLKNFNKNQLDSLFVSQNTNLTYEQLIELNLNEIAEFETNLDEIKCINQPSAGQQVNELPLLINNDSFNSKFNLIYLDKIERRRNDRKLSILDAFQREMRSCVQSLTNNSNNLFNEINYLKYFLLYCSLLKSLSSF